MNNILKIVIGGALSLTMTSCYVSSMAVTDQSPGEVYVNYYPYYFCPEQNFYFNPDMNIYWWNQGGLWVSGSHLPYGYAMNYNTNYVIITAYDRNPTRYYSEHIREYRRGYYEQNTYHVGDRPMQSLRSYRPERMTSGSRSGNNYRSDDIYGPRRSQNYNNQGSRSNSSYQSNGSRSSDVRQSQSSGNQGYSNDNSNTVRQGSRTDNSGRFNSGSSTTRRQSDNSAGQPSTNTRQQTTSPGTPNNNYYNRESRRRQQSDNTGSRQQTAPTPQPQSRSSQASGQDGSRSSSSGDRQDSSRRSTREESTNTK